ncbi:MAG: 50S ribosomal protein L13 [Thiotrichales bacterium]|nr:MAG: 50S ribosomal protein L13 [Thiotrichales bacterium]
MKKTYSAKTGEVSHDWYIVDATDKILGRLATEVARRLRGKHKPEFTTHIDTGDNIIVINCDKIRVTGKKETDKTYYWHTGYPGGLKSTTLDKLRAKDSTIIIEKAVKGMLPKNPLGRVMFSKLKLYAGAEHPHTAQQPKELSLDQRTKKKVN